MAMIEQRRWRIGVIERYGCGDAFICLNIWLLAENLKSEVASANRVVEREIASFPSTNDSDLTVFLPGECDGMSGDGMGVVETTCEARALWWAGKEGAGSIGRREHQFAFAQIGARELCGRI